MKRLINLPKQRRLHFRLFLFLIFVMYVSSQNLVAGSFDIEKRFTTQLEFGPVLQGRNDVQIPNNNSGTRFSLVDLVGNGPYPSVRFYFTWRINERHSLRLLLAPLSYTETGSFSNPVSFASQNYLPGQSVEATYKFNSWRLTYSYKFHQGQHWFWWIGFTAKIRDAKIKLEQNDVTSQKTDLGFVPLLHIRGEYHFDDKWWMLFDLDALAGGPGRAEDGTVQLGYHFNNQWSASIGYRTVEGGADVEEVYNFAWFHYFVISTNFTF